MRLSAPTSGWILASVPPVLVFLVTALDREYQYDLWHHLARGRAIVTQGHLVNTDQFSYTVAGQPFQDVNWLTQVVYYLLYLRGGLDLVQLVNSLTLAATMALVVHCCWRASGSLKVGCALGVFTFLGLWQMLTIRPQTFSLFLFVVLYEILDLSGRRPWLLLLAPGVMALWVNLHGAFPIGFLLIGGFLLAAAWEGWQGMGWGFWRDRRTALLAFCLGACLLAVLVNPYGWNVYQYVGLTSSRASNRGIMEWMPPGLKLFIGKVWVVSVLLLLAGFALPCRRPTPRDLCLVFLFLPLACGAVRMVGWWFLVSAPVLAGRLAAALPDTWLEGPEPERPSLAAGFSFGLVLMAAVACAPGVGPYLPLGGLSGRAHRTNADLEAVAGHLRTVPGSAERIFTKYEWGEYLSWSLAPDGSRVFMDCRIEIYPDDVWADYLAVTHGRADWQDILDRYGVTCLVLDAWHTHQVKDLLPQIEKSGAWTRAFTSGDALLFLRAEPYSLRAP
jgi:hypothetical protein